MSSIALTSTVVRPVREADLPTIIALETASYPADEAATPEKLRYRFENAPQYFMVLETGVDREVIGFVCATASTNAHLTHESMSVHEKEGTTVCIHSVVIKDTFRRHGLAQYLLHRYVEYVSHASPITQFLLLTHEHNMKLYEKCGFSLVGVSDVSHGSEVWMEMRRTVTASMRLPSYHHVDAFVLRQDNPDSSDTTTSSSKLNSGNPAGVVILPGVHEPIAAWDGVSSDWMQAVAAEFRAPVTAFLRFLQNGHFAVRFFTNIYEIPLCGHASLAIGHIFFSDVRLLPADQQKVSLLTKAGNTVEITRLHGISDVKLTDLAVNPTVQLRFPAAPHTAVPVEELNAVLELLPAMLSLPESRLKYVEFAENGVHFVGKNALDMLIVVSPDIFVDMKVNIDVIAKLPSRIISITCKQTSATADKIVLKDGYNSHINMSDYAMVSRCFSPRGGNPEDPVCGAAHCGILPYWHSRKLAGEHFNTALQPSPRGGILYLALDGDAVLLRGAATTFATGVLHL